MKKHALKLIIWLFIGIAALLMGGCANFKQASLEMHYYTIEYVPPSPAIRETLPYVIKIDHFQTSPLYDSNRIVFKRGEFTRDEYVYHKWRANPGELVTFYLARDFSETGQFKATLYADSISPYTHLIAGSVEDFYQQENNSDWEAVLTISITLIDNALQSADSPVLLQKKYRLREKITEKNPAGLAKALSSAMQQISAMVMEDIHALLSTNFHT